jgi:protein O-GlcNAc transferase
MNRAVDITTRPRSIAQVLDESLAFHQAGDMDRAEAGYREILKRAPNHADALHLLGMIRLHREDYPTAAELIQKAVDQHPDTPFYYNNLGLARMGLGHANGARECFERALALKPDYAEAWFNLGRFWYDSGERARAVSCMETVLDLDPGSALAHAWMGEMQLAAGNPGRAVESFQQILSSDPNHVQARHNLGLAFHDLGRLSDAIACFRDLIAEHPRTAQAHNSLGAVLNDLGRKDAARICFERALAIAPRLAAAHNNLGNLFQDAGRYEAAAASYGRALDIDPQLAAAHNNLGMALQETGQAVPALAHYRRAIELRPDYAEACAHLVHMLQRACDWDGLRAAEKHLDQLTGKALSSGGRVAEQPFVSLVRGAEPARQLAIAKAWADRAARLAFGAGKPFAHQASTRDNQLITIGYLSANFRNHPMAHLMAGLFEHHDRQRFRVHGYAFGEDDGSDYRRRIAAGCDRFVDIAALDHADAARRIHADGVDILVDLMGHTKGNRMAICALRPAPVQVRYLGLAGTTGADYFDYLVCDAVVVPEALAPHYSEKPIHMPHCYQVNDHRQPIDPREWTRVEAGLPRDATVFCCFNHAYKIDPVIFDAWMAILSRVPHAVLWLLSTTDLAEANLRARATARGISPARLVFAEKLPKPRHLARLRLADLALDTRLVSGAATTSDALWAGVPVITLVGQQFAANMSASILSAMGLAELITHCTGDFIALAENLASNPQRLAGIREKLARNRTTAPLFDTRRFVRNLERGYRQIWERYRSGHAPGPIRVVENGEGAA